MWGAYKKGRLYFRGVNVMNKYTPLGRVESQDYVFKGKILNLRRDTVTTTSGRLVSREIVEHLAAVTIIAVNKRGKLAMVSQYRYPVDKRMYEFPAGLIDKGESAEAAAERELQEEIGYKPGRLVKISRFYTSPGFTDEKITLFLATDLIESKLPEDDDEDIKVDWFSVQEIERMCSTTRIFDAKTILGFYLYCVKRSELCLL